ncbi:hypothetical protein LEN26_016427 [Aphanomyces euteiches]|nr:hypothetical protein LEN26_016427 [Aphanomyces euteiches]KAH9104311.1 hypothetical protein AeMF1_019581 [Aphanomyces euteiches]KAH9166223.1 hypothetical protein AeNC1_018383 [Aphanomyces euteiches]
MRLSLHLTLGLFALTAYSRALAEGRLRATESRSLVEAAGGQAKKVPPAGVKGDEWINSHLSKHGKTSFGISKDKFYMRDKNFQLITRAKGVSSPLANPARYDSRSMVKLKRQEKAANTQNGQEPPRIKRTKDNPKRDSPQMAQTRKEHHLGRK